MDADDIQVISKAKRTVRAFLRSHTTLVRVKWTRGHFCTVAVPHGKEEHIGTISMAVIGNDDIVGIRACGFGKDISRRSVSIAPPRAGRGID